MSFPNHTNYVKPPSEVTFPTQFSVSWQVIHLIRDTNVLPETHCVRHKNNKLSSSQSSRRNRVLSKQKSFEEFFNMFKKFCIKKLSHEKQPRKLIYLQIFFFFLIYSHNAGRKRKFVHL